ncbi:unnamed protein product [Schistosoma turkestanicum]|nr:unnamed protein product [Schistosoma turkestanicum]
MMHRSKSNQMLQVEHLQELYDHWTNCKSLINEKDNAVLSISKIETVFYHVGKIILLVIDEHFSNTVEKDKLVEGSYLEALIKTNIFELLLIWIEGNPTPKDEKAIGIRDILRRYLITAFDQLITQSKQSVLLHRPILQPLCQFLFKLSSQLRPSYDQIYGRLLHEVCILLCRNFQLLEFSKKIAHPHVCDQLLHFIHSGFLIPVLGSALHQNAMDEVIAATAYLELFLRRLTEPLMIRLFLKFIITESYDSYHILTSIMNRLNASAMLITDKRYQLGMVTLSLFRTILNFHCEDVMYELIFK